MTKETVVCYILVGTMCMLAEQDTKKYPEAVPWHIHCCHWLPKELSIKAYQNYQRVESP